jgi:imidazoleglycerol-phosphate dehydratase
MLDQLSRHSLVDIVPAEGDRHIDDHHGRGVGSHSVRRWRRRWAKARLTRYAACLLPMDETLTGLRSTCQAGRSLSFGLSFRQRRSEFRYPTQHEFFRASPATPVTLHIETLYGSNSHHIADRASGLLQCFAAIAIDSRQAGASHRPRAL